MDALGSGLFYAGVVTTLIGLFSLIRPLRWVGIRTRRRGVLVATFGAVLGLGTTVLPTPVRTTAARDMLIDQWLPPEWQFGDTTSGASALPRRSCSPRSARSVV